MSTPLAQFIRESIQRARTELSYQDALDYLRGTVEAFEDQSEEIARFRETILNLDFCDRQLVLIAEGQLRLDFVDGVCLPVFRTTAERLQWARRDRKLTLAKLAASCGVPLTRISEYAHGRSIPVTDAARLSLALQLPPDWLLTGSEAQPLAHAA